MEPEGLSRGKERKEGAFVLRELTPEERPEEHGGHRMERPATIEIRHEALAVPARSLAHGERDCLDKIAPTRHLRTLLDEFERRRNEPHQLIRLLLEDEVGEPALDLG